MIAMPKILIVHPEGNIKNNPSLFAITKMIVERGWDVLVYSRRQPGIYQGEIIRGARFVYFGESVKETSKIEKSFRDENIRFVIGIDDVGIYKAQKIASFLCVPYLFLSYEILFDHEIKTIGCRADRRNKRRAKKSVKGIRCVIVQDETRKACISREYNVPEKKIILMPVSNTGSHLLPPSNYFHRQLGIPLRKHILLYMGWMDAKQERRLLSFVPYMPDDWVIVAHSRYKYVATIQDVNIGEKLFISFDKPIENIDEMGTLLSDCDAGFCTYEPSDDSIYTGDNIRYIGLSSGKTTTFLQYGVPVVIENMNIWDDLVERYGFGFELKKLTDLSRLNEILDGDKSKKAINFFDNHLDAALFFPKVWEVIEKDNVKSSYKPSAFYEYIISMYLWNIVEKSKNSVKLLLGRNK